MFARSKTKLNNTHTLRVAVTLHSSLPHLHTNLHLSSSSVVCVPCSSLCLLYLSAWLWCTDTNVYEVYDMMLHYATILSLYLRVCVQLVILGVLCIKLTARLSELPARYRTTVRVTRAMIVDGFKGPRVRSCRAARIDVRSSPMCAS